MKPLQIINNYLPIVYRGLQPLELLKSLIITRFISGILRVEQNVPKAKRKPEHTQAEKYASLIERCFMELIGVPMHAICVYLFMEPFSALFERTALRLPNLAKQFIPNHQTDVLNYLKGTIFGTKAHPHGLIAEQMFKPLRLRNELAQIRSKAPQALQEPLKKFLESFQKRLWVSSAAALFLGVLGSAFVTGYVLQKANDKLVATRLTPWMERKMGLLPPNNNLNTHPKPVPGYTPPNYRTTYPGTVAAMNITRI